NLQDLTGRDLAPNQHRKVPPNPRKTREGPGLRRPPTTGGKPVEKDLGNHRPAGQSELRQQLRVHLADDPDWFAIVAQLPRAARMKTGEDAGILRSEERRVGKEWRDRWG